MYFNVYLPIRMRHFFETFFLSTNKQVKNFQEGKK